KVLRRSRDRSGMPRAPKRLGHGTSGSYRVRGSTFKDAKRPKSRLNNAKLVGLFRFQFYVFRFTFYAPTRESHRFGGRGGLEVLRGSASLLPLELPRGGWTDHGRGKERQRQ